MIKAISLRTALQASAAVLLLSFLVPSTASARFLILPKAMPTQPAAGQLSAACGGPVRASTLDILGSLRTTYASAAKVASSGTPSIDKATGLRTVAIYAGGQHYIAFKLLKSIAKISTPDFLDCISVYGGSADMVRNLGLYVPDDSIDRGSFFYAPRIGIYVDPRLVVPFAAHK